MIDVLIVDDNAVIRRGVAALLADISDVQVVGEASDGAEALRLTSQAEPDVVLLDVRMPVMDGIEAAGPLSERARVMMLTYTDEKDQVVAAIRAGASGYLVHGQFDADELVTRIRELAAGDTVLSPAVVGTVFEALRRTPGSPDEAGPASLTAREQRDHEPDLAGPHQRPDRRELRAQREDGEEPRQPHLLQSWEPATGPRPRPCGWAPPVPWAFETGGAQIAWALRAPVWASGPSR